MGKLINWIAAKLFFFIPALILRKILSWILSVVLCLVVLFIILLFSLDSIAKAGVEKIVPLVTGTAVSVQSISIKPFRGRVEVRELVIENPGTDVYTSGYAIRLGNVAAEVDLATLFQKKLVINEVKLNDIFVNFETDKTFSRSNIGDLLNNVNKFAGEEKKKAEEEKKKEKQKLQLNTLTMDNLSLNVLMNGQKVLPLSLSLGTFGPFGETEEGLTGPEVIQVIFSEFFDRIFSSVKQLLINKLGKEILIDELGGALQKELKSLLE